MRWAPSQVTGPKPRLYQDFYNKMQVSPVIRPETSPFAVSSFSLYYCAENCLKPFDITDNKVP